MEDYEKVCEEASEEASEESSEEAFEEVSEEAYIWNYGNGTNATNAEPAVMRNDYSSRKVTCKNDTDIFSSQEVLQHDK